MLTASQVNGKRGENIACSYLEDQNYQICERNFRSGYAEIDIIAKKGDKLIFVEVRTRSSLKYGYPEQTISPEKEEKILEGAEHYIIQSGWNGEIRFDIIAIECFPNLEIEHLEDVFF